EAASAQRSPRQGRRREAAAQDRGGQEDLGVRQAQRAAGQEREAQHQRGRHPSRDLRREADRLDVRDDQAGERQPELTAETDRPPRARASFLEGRRALRRFWPTNRLDGANRKSRIVLQLPGLRPPGARGRLQRDRRVVRDAGQGGEVPRGPVRQGSPAGEVGVKRGFRQDGWRTGGEGAASSSPSAAAAATTMKLPIAEPVARDWADDPHGMAYDNPRFWDETHLEGEVDRVFELCYECKLCFPKCPYVPPHEFAVDFPRLMLRAKMRWAKEDGIAFRERFLGATDAIGTAMTKIAPLANAAAHNRFNRVLMEHTVGIHRDRQLPAYAPESFLTWWSRRAPVVPPAQPSASVALFATCYGNYNDPEIPKAAVEVLEHAGCSLTCPEQVCCGMPKLDGGDLEGARKLARKNIETLLPAVREGRKILSPGPSCTLTLRTEYPELVPTAEAKEVAEAVMDLSDFLLQQARKRKLPKEFPQPIGRVAYHVA